MSFRTALLATVDSIRSIAGPTGFDIRVNQLSIRTRTWDGGRIGLGNSSDSDLVLPARYPIRYVSAQEIFSAAGEYEQGDVLVDHITPSDGTIGYTQAQLRPQPTSDAVEILYILTGTHAGLYRCIDVRTYRAFTSQLVLRRRGDPP